MGKRPGDAGTQTTQRAEGEPRAGSSTASVHSGERTPAEVNDALRRMLAADMRKKTGATDLACLEELLLTLEADRRRTEAQ